MYAELCKGNFTVNISQRSFSRMSLDKSHKQNNACVKKQGGTIGLTETPTGLIRWMVAGPEMARLVTEFLDGIDKPGLVSDTRHHEDNPAAQATVLRHVESLVSSMSEMVNPFMDPSGDLLVLDTRVFAALNPSRR